MTVSNLDIVLQYTVMDRYSIRVPKQRHVRHASLSTLNSYTIRTSFFKCQCNASPLLNFFVQQNPTLNVWCCSISFYVQQIHMQIAFFYYSSSNLLYHPPPYNRSRLKCMTIFMFLDCLQQNIGLSQVIDFIVDKLNSEITPRPFYVCSQTISQNSWGTHSSNIQEMLGKHHVDCGILKKGPKKAKI